MPFALPSRAHRALAGTAVAAVAALALTACGQSITATISSDHTVSGTAILSVSSQELGLQATNGGDSATILANDRATMKEDLLAAFPTGKVTDWQDAAGDQGEQVTYKNLSFSDFDKALTTAYSNPNAGTAPTVSLKYTGGHYTLEATDLDTSYLRAQSPMGISFDTLSLTFPQPVTSTTGTVDGTTVTWDLNALSQPVSDPSSTATDSPSASPTPVSIDATTTRIALPVVGKLGKGGILKVGKHVHLVTPATPAGATRSLQWYADGKAIKGADGWNLLLTKGMVGKTITATATYRHVDYDAKVLKVGFGKLKAPVKHHHAR
jgi:hypothetical protein